MNISSKILWQAYSEADDYFARLGGSGRYLGFRDYHIPALVIVLALARSSVNRNEQNDFRSLLPCAMWDCTDGLPQRVEAIIHELEGQNDSQLSEFIEYVNSLYQRKSPLELARWGTFLTEVEAAT